MSIRTAIEKEMTTANIKPKYWPVPSVYRFIIVEPNFAEVFAAVLKCETICEFKFQYFYFDITISAFEDEAHDLIELTKLRPDSCAYIADAPNTENFDPAYGIAGWKFL